MGRFLVFLFFILCPNVDFAERGERAQLKEQRTVPHNMLNKGGAKWVRALPARLLFLGFYGMIE